MEFEKEVEVMTQDGKKKITMKAITMQQIPAFLSATRKMEDLEEDAVQKIVELIKDRIQHNFSNQQELEAVIVHNFYPLLDAFYELNKLGYSEEELKKLDLLRRRGVTLGDGANIQNSGKEKSGKA